MSFQVLLIQPDSKSTQFLVDYFTKWQDEVWHASMPAEANAILKQHQPDLLVVDLHLLSNGWRNLLSQIRQELPNSKILFTTSYPDPAQETRAKKEYHVRTFLRQPFSSAGVEQALRNLEGIQPVETDLTFKANLPKVRIPVRLKITFPYMVLAVLLALAAAYVVTQIIVDTIEERFTNQLIEAGKLTNDWIVNEEDRLLETLRLVSNTIGVSEAVVIADAERLRELVLPLAVNYENEAIEILDQNGTSLLSLRHLIGGNLEEYDITRGENIFSQWDFVQGVLAGQIEQGRDKHAGLARAPWGDYLYVAGPITDESGHQVGAILVGKSLPTLGRQIRQDTLAHTTLYDLDGQPIASTFSAFDQVAAALSDELISNVLARQDEASLTRPLDIASINYTEIMGPLEVGEFFVASSRTNHDLGLIGTSLAETFLARPGQITRVQIFVLTTITFILVIALGVYLANRITHPLLQVVNASAEVAKGNLEVLVDDSGNDEVAVLAHSFNQMVSGLREGYIYRDLFGRTVSPEVRDQLRQGFASGDLRLEGQETVATVLICNIQGFTTLSETEAPETIMNWLNEYFSELVPVITCYGGVISKFEGDAILAFFGILPRPISAQESTYRACKAALGMLDAVDRLNSRRQIRAEPPFSVGIGIHTGPVTAGGLGSADRIHYTVIGDTVNATTRLEGVTRQFGDENSAVISQHTLFALRESRHEFELESMGAYNVRGKVEQLLVYRLHPLKNVT
jgi:adenylate cyclase